MEKFMEEPKKYHFRHVSLLITHFNRSASLNRLLKTCKELNYIFDDIIVSDDASSAEHFQVLLELRKVYSFKLITSPANMGLGHNLNKGQDAVTTPLTLYVQEDFIPLTAFGEHFLNAIDLITSDPKLDFIRFYAYIKYPYLSDFKLGYSNIVYNFWALDYKKIYVYSDHPHLRRTSFLNKFGRYKEGISGDKTEYRMCISVIQNRAKALFFNEYKSLFKQVNSEAEPSTMSRIKWTQSNNLLIKLIRNVYRQVKYNCDILLMNHNDRNKI